MAETETKDNEKFFEADAGDGTTRESQYLTGRKLIICTISLLSCLFLFGLDQTIVAPAITIIGNEFDGIDKIGWVGSAFFLPVVVLAVTWGRIAVIFGRKYIMVIAVVIFEAGSLMCALSTNMNLLIGGRALAGVGAGGIQSLTFMILNEIVPIHNRAYMFASLGATFALSSVMGPLIGGALVQNVTWRWCFYINLPIGGAALVGFLLSFNPPLPSGNWRQKLKILDYFGIFLLAAGLVLFLLGLTFGAESQYPWRSGAVITCIVLGALITIGFGVWNFKFSKHRIIPNEVITTIPVLAAAVTFVFDFGFFMANIYYLTIYLQNVIGKSAIGTGVSLLAFIVPVVISSIVSGVLINRTRFVKPFIMFGAILAPIGCGLFTLLDENSGPGARIGLLIPAAVGFGCLVQGLNMSGQLAAPKVEGGAVMTATFLVFGRALGGAIATILAELIYNTSLKLLLKSSMANLTDPDLISEFQSINIIAVVSNTGLLSTLSPKARQFIRHQMVKAIRNVFYLGLGLSLALLVSSVFTSNARVPKQEEVSQASEKSVEEATDEGNLKDVDSQQMV